MTQDMRGKRVVITGANSGLGFESVRALAAAGATVIMACRNAQKAQAAVDKVLAETPGADVSVRTLDLASLASIKAFADGMKADFTSIDVLLNNAGLMAIPRTLTADGFEMQLGTNHLGHFALTGQLLELLEASPAVAAELGQVEVRIVGTSEPCDAVITFCQSAEGSRG